MLSLSKLGGSFPISHEDTNLLPIKSKNVPFQIKSHSTLLPGQYSEMEEFEAKMNVIWKMPGHGKKTE